MNQETIEALKASIKQWEKNVYFAARISLDTNDIKVCSKSSPLCVKFLRINGCEKCPVYLKTNRHYCLRTPYSDVRDILDVLNQTPKELSKNLQEELVLACEQELNFLKSLLPKEEKHIYLDVEPPTWLCNECRAQWEAGLDCRKLEQEETQSPF
jgi:hypothetical protein